LEELSRWALAFELWQVFGAHKRKDKARIPRATNRRSVVKRKEVVQFVMTSVMKLAFLERFASPKYLIFEELGAGKGNRTLMAITKFFAAIRGDCCEPGVTIGSQRMLS